MLLADALARQGGLDLAIAELRSALRLNPDNPDAHNRLGDILARGGRIDDATAEYVEAKRLRPDPVCVLDIEAITRLNAPAAPHINGIRTPKFDFKEATSLSEAEVRASLFKASRNLFSPQPHIAPEPVTPPFRGTLSPDRTVRGFTNDDNN